MILNAKAAALYERGHYLGEHIFTCDKHCTKAIFLQSSTIAYFESASRISILKPSVYLHDLLVPMPQLYYRFDFTFVTM